MDQDNTMVDIINYPIQQKKLIMPEYGRHIQQLVTYATTLQDKAERTSCAKGIIEVMGNLFPHLRDTEDFQHILWDHIAIMSNFELDIDYPCEIIEKENFYTKPDTIPYPSTQIKYMHYGRNLEKMIEKAIQYQEGEEKNELIKMIANQMKRSYLNWNKEDVEDKKIFDDLKELSNGKINLDENNIKLLHSKQILGVTTTTTNGGKKNTRKKRKKQ